MAVTSVATSSGTLSLNTESFIDVATAGVFVYVVDLNALADGDVLVCRAYLMHTTSGTARKLYEMRYYDAQPAYDLISMSPPVSNDLTDATSLRFSLEQIAGTGRAVPRKVLKHA